MSLLDDLRAAVRPSQPFAGGAGAPQPHGLTLTPWEPRQPPLTPTCDARAAVLRNGVAVAMLYRLTAAPQPFQHQHQPPDPGPIPPFTVFQLHDLATGRPLATSLHIEALLASATVTLP